MTWNIDKVALSDLKEWSKNTLSESLGIEITKIEENIVIGTMPVDKRTIQPAGILHGGASVALAETLGSIGSLLHVKHENKVAVGLTINSNHISSIKEGVVTGEAFLLHKGRSTHVWNIELKNEAKKLLSTHRLTMMIL